VKRFDIKFGTSAHDGCLNYYTIDLSTIDITDKELIAKDKIMQ